MICTHWTSWGVRVSLLSVILCLWFAGQSFRTSREALRLTCQEHERIHAEIEGLKIRVSVWDYLDKMNNLFQHECPIEIQEKRAVACPAQPTRYLSDWGY